MSKPPSRIIIPGSHVTKKGAYVFVCPVCSKQFRYDDAYEPLCTGPHPSLDEHEPTVMVRTGTPTAPLDTVTVL